MKEIVAYRPKHETRLRMLGVVVCLLVYAALTAALVRGFGPARGAAAVSVVTGTTPPGRNISVHDGFFFVDGQPFVPKAVGWDPVRPGELPWERPFHPEEIEDDLRRIRAAGFNTVRTWAALRDEELALVAKHELFVLQGIWVAPDGRFDDPAFRRESLRKVARVVESSRWSPVVLGYLVWNEPRAQAVAKAGVNETLALLREVIATVRALEPSAPIGIASWPGLEIIDDDLLDFVGFNIYPHRPRVVMNELGLGGYVRLIDRTVARGRPLVVTEFGVSVSPRSTTPLRGGVSEAEQGPKLCGLLDTYISSGAVGTSVFQWSDGWWKNNSVVGDEMEHDPADPEEWFGLVSYSGLDDRSGKGRPALAAFAECQQALVLKPRNGAVDPQAVPVWIYTAEPVRLEIVVDDGAPRPVVLSRSGRHVSAGVFSLPAGGVRHDVAFRILSTQGKLLKTERRLLRTAPARTAKLAITPESAVVEPGQPFFVDVELTGAGDARGSVTVFTYTEDRFNEETSRTQIGKQGRGRVRFVAPDQETLLTILAFEDDPAIPQWERAAAWTVVEVRGRP